MRLPLFTPLTMIYFLLICMPSMRDTILSMAESLFMTFLEFLQLLGRMYSMPPTYSPVPNSGGMSWSMMMMMVVGAVWMVNWICPGMGMGVLGTIGSWVAARTEFKRTEDRRSVQGDENSQSEKDGPATTTGSNTRGAHGENKSTAQLRPETKESGTQTSLPDHPTMQLLPSGESILLTPDQTPRRVYPQPDLDAAISTAVSSAKRTSDSHTAELLSRQQEAHKIEMREWKTKRELIYIGWRKDLEAKHTEKVDKLEKDMNSTRESRNRAIGEMVDAFERVEGLHAFYRKRTAENEVQQKVKVEEMRRGYVEEVEVRKREYEERVATIERAHAEHVASLTHTHSSQIQVLTTTHATAQRSSAAQTQALKSSLRSIAHETKHTLALLHKRAHDFTTENTSLRKENHTLSAKLTSLSWHHDAEIGSLREKIDALVVEASCQVEKAELNKEALKKLGVGVRELEGQKEELMKENARLQARALECASEKEVMRLEIEALQVQASAQSTLPQAVQTYSFSARELSETKQEFTAKAKKLAEQEHTLCKLKKAAAKPHLQVRHLEGRNEKLALENAEFKARVETVAESHTTEKSCFDAPTNTQPTLTIAHPKIVYNLLPASGDEDYVQAASPSAEDSNPHLPPKDTCTLLNQMLVDILNSMPIESPPKVVSTVPIIAPAESTGTAGPTMTLPKSEVAALRNSASGVKSLQRQLERVRAEFAKTKKACVERAEKAEREVEELRAANSKAGNSDDATEELVLKIVMLEIRAKEAEGKVERLEGELKEWRERSGTIEDEDEHKAESGTEATTSSEPNAEPKPAAPDDWFTKLATEPVGSLLDSLHLPPDNSKAKPSSSAKAAKGTLTELEKAERKLVAVEKKSEGITASAKKWKERAVAAEEKLAKLVRAGDKMDEGEDIPHPELNKLKETAATLEAELKSATEQVNSLRDHQAELQAQVNKLSAENAHQKHLLTLHSSRNLDADGDEDMGIPATEQVTTVQTPSTSAQKATLESTEKELKKIKAELLNARTLNAKFKMEVDAERLGWKKLGGEYEALKQSWEEGKAVYVRLKKLQADTELALRVARHNAGFLAMDGWDTSSSSGSDTTTATGTTLTNDTAQSSTTSSTTSTPPPTTPTLPLSPTIRELQATLATRTTDAENLQKRVTELEGENQTLTDKVRSLIAKELDTRRELGKTVLDAEIERDRARKASATKCIGAAELSEKAESLTKERNASQADVKTLHLRISELEKEAKKTEDDIHLAIAEMESQLAAVEDELKAVKKALSTTQEQLEFQTRAANEAKIEAGIAESKVMGFELTSRKLEVEIEELRAEVERERATREDGDEVLVDASPDTSAYTSTPVPGATGVKVLKPLPKSKCPTPFDFTAMTTLPSLTPSTTSTTSTTCTPSTTSTTTPPTPLLPTSRKRPQASDFFDASVNTDRNEAQENPKRHRADVKKAATTTTSTGTETEESHPVADLMSTFGKLKLREGDKGEKDGSGYIDMDASATPPTALSTTDQGTQHPPSEPRFPDLCCRITSCPHLRTGKKPIVSPQVQKTGPVGLLLPKKPMVIGSPTRSEGSSTPKRKPARLIDEEEMRRLMG